MTRRSCNVLVIGGGLAGIQAAEVTAQFVSDVLLVDRATVGAARATGRDASILAAYLAQDVGGLSDWKSTRVSVSVQGSGGPGTVASTDAVQRGFGAYLDDIARCGGHLGDPQLADFTASGVYNRIGWLESYGLPVVRDAARTYRGFPSAGHGLGRVLLVEAPPRTVIENIRKSAEVFGVRCADGLHVTRLLVDGGRVSGAYALDVRTGDGVAIEATAVILASGGADRLYAADPSGTTGSGYQLALDAGTELANMEFVGFGPEATQATDLPPGLLMILLGLGARLEAEDGTVVAGAVGSPAQLARGLARAASRQRVALHVPADVRAGVAGVRAFDDSASLLEHPIDLRVGCHGLLGGVVHRAFATSVSGLFVAGGAATGCHGADVLTGVDTSFTLYSAENAATAAATHWSMNARVPLADDLVRAEEKRLAERRNRSRSLDGRRLAELEDAIRRVMWEHAGPERTGGGLAEARHRLREVRTEIDASGAATGADLVALCELDALVATAELVSDAASRRQESRGQHARADFPSLDEVNGRCWITVARRDATLAWTPVPVPAGS